MNAFKIRDFAGGDIEPALELWRRTEGIGLSEADRPDRIRAFLERNPGLSHVAEAGGGLIGTVLCGSDGRRGYIHHLAAAAEWRRRGVGGRLLTAALAGLRGIGILKCHAFVFRCNPFGEIFWSHSGWQRRDELGLYSRMVD